MLLARTERLSPIRVRIDWRASYAHPPLATSYVLLSRGGVRDGVVGDRGRGA